MVFFSANASTNLLGCQCSVLCNEPYLSFTIFIILYVYEGVYHHVFDWLVFYRIHVNYIEHNRTEKEKKTLYVQYISYNNFMKCQICKFI